MLFENMDICAHTLVLFDDMDICAYTLVFFDDMDILLCCLMTWTFVHTLLTFHIYILKPRKFDRLMFSQSSVKSQRTLYIYSLLLFIQQRYLALYL